MNYKEISDGLNDQECILKVLEESHELCEVLVKSLTKSKPPPLEKVIEEAGDLFFRLNVLCCKFGITKEVLERINFKEEVILEYVRKKQIGAS
jgi:phosphoribosyl-ATP pyrophosphohydrolase